MLTNQDDKGTGEAALRAEKFGDLTTADHKVFNEEGESRNNHRYTDNSLEFGKSFEELSWNHRTSTPHLRRIGLQKERYAE